MTERACATERLPDTFKSCSNCESRWKSLETFIGDPHIELIGYMPTFDDLLRGLFLFNHRCGTTLACRVSAFRHLYDGPVYPTPRTGQPDCLGYCLNQSELAACPVHCHCAYVRETLRIIRKWPKAGRREAAAHGWSAKDEGIDP